MANQKLIAVLTIGPMNPGDVVTVPHGLVQSDTDPHIAPLVVWPDRATAISVIGTPTRTDVTFQNLGSVQEPEQNFFVWRESTILGRDPFPGVFWRGLGPNSGSSGITGDFTFGEVKKAAFTNGALTSLSTATGVYNVLDYGAVADYGAGDTDNGPFFQAAFDACAAGGGGTVYAPPGKYFFATGVSLALNTIGHSIKFCGEGVATQLVLLATDANVNPNLVSTDFFYLTQVGSANAIFHVCDLILRRIDKPNPDPDPWVCRNVFNFATADLQIIVERCVFLGLAVTQSLITCNGGSVFLFNNGSFGSAGSTGLFGSFYDLNTVSAVVDGWTQFDYANFEGQYWSEGACHSLILYRAPAPRGQMTDPYTMLSVRNGLVDEDSAHAVAVENSDGGNSYLDRCYIENIHHNNSANPTVLTATISLFQVKRAWVERVWSGYWASPGIAQVFYDSGDVTICNCSSPTSTAGPNKVYIDPTPFAGPYTTSVQLIESTFLSILPNELAPLVIKERKTGIDFSLVFADETISQYALCGHAVSSFGWRVKNHPAGAAAILARGIGYQAAVQNDVIRLAEQRGQVITGLSDGTGVIAAGTAVDPSATVAGRLMTSGGDPIGLALTGAIAVAGTPFLLQLKR